MKTLWIFLKSQSVHWKSSPQVVELSLFLFIIWKSPMSSSRLGGWRLILVPRRPRLPPLPLCVHLGPASSDGGRGEGGLPATWGEPLLVQDAGGGRGRPRPERLESLFFVVVEISQNFSQAFSELIATIKSHWFCTLNLLLLHLPIGFCLSAANSDPQVWVGLVKDGPKCTSAECEGTTKWAQSNCELIMSKCITLMLDLPSQNKKVARRQRLRVQLHLHGPNRFQWRGGECTICSTRKKIKKNPYGKAIYHHFLIYNMKNLFCRRTESALASKPWTRLGASTPTTWAATLRRTGGPCARLRRPAVRTNCKRFQSKRSRFRTYELCDWKQK